MAILNLSGNTSNVYTFGNSSADSITIAESNDGNILSYSTYDNINNVWKVWQSDQPPFLQVNFGDILPGVGYVVTTSGPTAVNLPDSTLDLNNSPAVIGINSLSVDATYPPAACPKWEATEYSTYGNNVWKVWQSDQPPFLQAGFGDLVKDEGYVVRVSAVFDIAPTATVGEFMPFAASFGYPVENISEVDSAGLDEGLKYALEGMVNLI